MARSVDPPNEGADGKWMSRDPFRVRLKPPDQPIPDIVSGRDESEILQADPAALADFLDGYLALTRPLKGDKGVMASERRYWWGLEYKRAFPELAEHVHPAWLRTAIELGAIWSTPGLPYRKSLLSKLGMRAGEPPGVG